MKKIFVTVLLICAANAVSAQSYRIDVTIKGLGDSTVLLAVHGGATKYAVDTAVLDKDGKGSFSKSRALEGGMYFLAVNGVALFDFLVSADGDDNFGIITDKNDYSKVEFVNSPENMAMSAYLDYRNQHQKKYEELIEQLRASAENSDEQKELRTRLLNFNNPLIAFSDSLANKYKGKFLATVVNAFKPPVEPDFNLPEDEPDRERKIAMNYYLFNKEHFLDNIDFNDERILRTPFFESNIIDYYFKNVLIFKEPDSIIPCVDKIMTRMQFGSKTYRYMLSHIFNFYYASTVMGHEEIVIYLGENYYLKPEVTWETEKFRTELINFIQRNKPTLIGKTSPDLMLPTSDGKRYESIHGLTADYTVLYFYDIDCGHCKEETPRIKNIYDKYKNELGLEIYAVYIQTDEKKWQDFIAENSLNWINVWDPYRTGNIHNTFNTVTTPQIYLLDKDKKILARRLDSENLDKLLQLYISRKEIDPN
ncbi:MAG: redoxin domain-containing protein [Prevotellaceae bacterium]|jgi:peroxiredoxin|nr:redoxin domain-containing protein [Prevotellaceae bacterium]